MKRNILSLSDYKSNLGDLHLEMSSIINLSVEDWNKFQAFSNTLELGLISYKPRTKAGIVHDHISHRIMNAFNNNPDIKVGEFNGVFGFLYKDLFFIRFKKMNPKNFKVSGINTEQNLKYHYQRTNIPGLPERPTILYAGYSLDKTGTQIRGIYTACWDGDQLMWIDEHGVESMEQVTFDFNQLNEKQQQKEAEKVIKRVTVKAGIPKRTTKTGTNK